MTALPATHRERAALACSLAGVQHHHPCARRPTCILLEILESTREATDAAVERALLALFAAGFSASAGVERKIHAYPVDTQGDDRCRDVMSAQPVERRPKEARSAAAAVPCVCSALQTLGVTSLADTGSGPRGVAIIALTDTACSVSTTSRRESSRDGRQPDRHGKIFYPTREAWRISVDLGIARFTAD